MASHAHIKDPQILLRLRQAIIRFIEEAQGIIDQGLQDCARAEFWIRSEQLPECRRSKLRAEQRYNESRLRYLAIKNAPHPEGRPAMEEVERDYRRHQRQLQMLEDRLERITHCLIRFPREVEAAVTRTRATRDRLSDQARAALARLDNMLEGLEHYLHPGSGESR